MSKKFSINCDEATTICDKSQYGDATLWEKIQLNWHIVICGFCKKYTRQNSLMTKLFDSYLENPCKKNELEKEEKAELERVLRKKLEELNQ